MKKRIALTPLIILFALFHGCQEHEDVAEYPISVADQQNVKITDAH